ncbi:MAG: hypothetical protein HYR48_05635 [Gemmatimonadetes bacterium]|nr:hypothetical protein [Gemmatimonadota bacterium]
MRRVLVAFVLLAAVAAPLSAQSNTAEMLQRARLLYEDLEVERALVILRQIVSPASPFEVSREQRVEAYKYLGAALALQQGQAKRDSAVLYFRAAIERDPFTDLDPRSFSPAQLEAFSEARGRTFAVALRPVPADTFDPRTEQITFRGLSSHLASLRMEVRLGGAARRILHEGDNEGLRETSWDGLLDDGTLAPEGRYELAVIGRSRLIALTDTASLYFEVSHDHAPLEDTLAALGPQDLLPEQHPASAAAADLLKGIGVAATALLIQTTLTSGDLGRGGGSLSGAVAGAGVVAGVAAFFVRQQHRDIPANIAENARRRAEHDWSNAAIRQRNDDILRETKLIVTPAAGARQ